MIKGQGEEEATTDSAQSVEEIETGVWTYSLPALNSAQKLSFINQVACRRGPQETFF